MKRGRLFGFLLMILLGLSVGLVYGWVINPPEVKNTTLSALRGDYKADYVLMVAESFSVDQDSTAALKSLKYLNPSDPIQVVVKRWSLASNWVIQCKK
jgi:hypothetical protein